jgi:hypothetical protein
VGSWKRWFLILCTISALPIIYCCGTLNSGNRQLVSYVTAFITGFFTLVYGFLLLTTLVQNWGAANKPGTPGNIADDPRKCCVADFYNDAINQCPNTAACPALPNLKASDLVVNTNYYMLLACIGLFIVAGAVTIVITIARMHNAPSAINAVLKMIKIGAAADGDSDGDGDGMQQQQEDETAHHAPATIGAMLRDERYSGKTLGQLKRIREVQEKVEAGELPEESVGASVSPLLASVAAHGTPLLKASSKLHNSGYAPMSFTEASVLLASDHSASVIGRSASIVSGGGGRRSHPMTVLHTRGVNTMQSMMGSVTKFNRNVY